MTLKLKRPLVIFDLETTGIQLTHDRIIELYLIRIKPDGSEMHFHARFNPGIPIPAVATSIHGIRNEDVAQEASFCDRAREIYQLMNDADLGGFNSNRFDLPMLVEEFNRCGLDFDTRNRHYVDAQRIFHQMEPRNLSAAYRFYCHKELNNAHSAEADTRATWEIIQAQIERYEQLEGSVPFIHCFTGLDQMVDLANRMGRDAEGIEIFNFGKYKGQRVLDVFRKEPSYYEWIMQGDFPADTKKQITRIWLSRMNAK